MIKVSRLKYKGFLSSHLVILPVCCLQNASLVVYNKAT